MVLIRHMVTPRIVARRAASLSACNGEQRTLRCVDGKQRQPETDFRRTAAIRSQGGRGHKTTERCEVPHSLAAACTSSARSGCHVHGPSIELSSLPGKSHGTCTIGVSDLRACRASGQSRCRSFHADTVQVGVGRCRPAATCTAIGALQVLHHSRTPQRRH